MSEEHTTAVIQRDLDELDGDSAAEPIVLALARPGGPTTARAGRHSAVSGAIPALRSRR